MKRLRFVITALLAIGLLSGCTFIGNTFKYRDTTKEFVESLLQKDYNKCVSLMAMDNPIAANTNLDTLKMGLANFRDIIVNNFGDKLDYSFMSSEKKWSTNTGESTPPNTTRVLMQFANDKEFGVFQVLFDDNSRKILNIKTLDVKAPIPKMVGFWLFGLLALCVPAFNIYMIVRIKRSQYRKKWLKYLAVIILNVPAITYNAVNGLSLQLLSFQILFGISFQYMGYLNSAWTFGIPLGGLYLLWQLKNGKDKPTEFDTEETALFETTDNKAHSE